MKKYLEKITLGLSILGQVGINYWKDRDINSIKNIHRTSTWTHHFCCIPVYHNICCKERKILGYFNTIHSYTEAPNQWVGVPIHVQRNSSDEWHFVCWTSQLIVRPEVEGGIDAFFHQRVVTVTLEVVFLAVKCDIVRVSPDLTVTGC